MSVLIQMRRSLLSLGRDHRGVATIELALVVGASAPDAGPDRFFPNIRSTP